LKTQTDVSYRIHPKVAWPQCGIIMGPLASVSVFGTASKQKISSKGVFTCLKGGEPRKKESRTVDHAP